MKNVQAFSTQKSTSSTLNMRRNSYLKVPPFEEGSAAADEQEASTAALASPSLPPAAVLQPGAPVAGPYFPDRIRV
jgi:hypothetical protein